MSRYISRLYIQLFLGALSLERVEKGCSSCLAIMVPENSSTRMSGSFQRKGKMTDRDLRLWGWSSLILAWCFVLVNFPWPALPLMFIAFYCFIKLALKDDGGGPPAMV